LLYEEIMNCRKFKPDWLSWPGVVVLLALLLILWVLLLPAPH